jgi:UDP-2,4-diacetamido-2,4,6-trideoxy-beta-L-altropyranose hydrolase
MSLGKILIRADASVEIGTGHVMRCLALAQAWQDAGGEAMFAMAESTPSIRARLAAENCAVIAVRAPVGSVEDANCVAEHARTNDAHWIVLDGYSFGPGYQECVTRARRKVMLVDDTAQSEYYCADFILNQNLNASESLYPSRLRQPCVLLGTNYVLLRREFSAWRKWNREIPPLARTVTVTIGGSDPEGFTDKLLDYPAFNGLAPTFLVGGSAQGVTRLIDSKRDDVKKDLSDITQILAGSDLAIICAGGTLWECLFMGCAVLSYTRNSVQDEIIECLHRMGAACNMGRISDFDRHRLAASLAELSGAVERRRRMWEVGRQLVDGMGAARVVQSLRDAA